MKMKGCMNIVNHIKENPLEGFDICYECGAVQESGTMQDVNEIDFDIFCDDCLESKEQQ